MIKLPSLILSSLLTLLLSINASANSIKGDAELEAITNHFAALIQEGNALKAYEQFTPYILVDKQIFMNAANKVSRDILNQESRTGQPLEVKQVKVQRIKDDFIKYYFLAKYKTAAIVWELTFYSPAKGWNLIGIVNYTDVNALFE